MLTTPKKEMIAANELNIYEIEVGFVSRNMLAFKIKTSQKYYDTQQPIWRDP